MFPAMGPYGKGGSKGAKHRGGQGTRGARRTLREVWASSGTTMEFADWVTSLQDQYDQNQDQHQQQQLQPQPNQ